MFRAVEIIAYYYTLGLPHSLNQIIMSISTVICIVQWILVYSSSHLLSLRAENCVWPQKCGGLTFSYPFRLEQKTCGLPGFDITCKGKSSSRSDLGTPYLPTLSGEVLVLNISYDHVLVDAANLYAFPCSKEMLIGDRFQETPYSGSCTSMCRYNQTLYGRRLPCKENGCCQMPVPEGYTRISLTARFLSSYGSDNCSNSASAIVDQDSWDLISNSMSFKASSSSLRIDWAILNDTCSSAQNKSSYQCSPNTECENRDWGYVCKCKTGYEGDGYTSGTRCKEIKNCTGFSCFQTLSIIIGVCGTLIAALLSGGSLFWILKLRKSKRDKENNFQRNGGDRLEKLISSRGGVEGMKLFTLDEIEKATNKFSENLILGSGGYGTVYKGTLTNESLVAVKRSKDVDCKEIDQFVNEVSILSQINHRNVVKLLGCCLETSVPLLVYEYISNGTLFDHLHGKRPEQQQLTWERRLRIATETAEALSYLHSAASIPIVHRDLTEKSDVYSFGVVLVELLTGLKPVSYERMRNQSNLAIFFLSTVNTRGFREIIDPRLDVDEGNNVESMRRVAGLAKECLSVEGEKRPSMKEVVQELLWSKGGERPHAWLNIDVVDKPEEMVGLIVNEEERREGIRSAYSVPEQCSSSFSIEGLGDGVRSGR
ncbi:hypothetical protein SUGI_0063680 [Cryptomeria japonica]|nr:hypothetical protein SUGI_0063680 [Cryptomeria japonica]